MKTTREILLERHRAATLKLDVIRRDVVSGVNNKETKEQNLNIFVALLLRCSENIWRELIYPSRAIWAGLAAIWIVIALANVSFRDHPQMSMAKTSPTPEMILAFRQEKNLLNELIGQSDTQPAEPPKIFAPRPSSRRQFEILSA